MIRSVTSEGIASNTIEKQPASSSASASCATSSARSAVRPCER